ncbi:hypothetical protein [Marinobacter fonticola]|uniref:hypothetical protein n=1 Tax=Marinobacter fonticola TaxID=2603215 RepID=UPI0011E69AF3|nr:hypothetical protein [Marinobacter fonticola]
MFRWIVVALLGVVVGNWLFRSNLQPVPQYGATRPGEQPNAPASQAGVQPGTPHPGVNKPV